MHAQPGQLTGAVANCAAQSRPRTRWLGLPPRLTDSELVCLAVAQAMLGFASEARWLPFVRSRLGAMLPYVPQRPDWNKRPRAALPLVKRAIRLLAADGDFWLDNHWIIDSTR
ncbi:hypothetical protein KE639_07315 [Streptomyces sp. V17-9]|nr:hypothetical protein KE639_07315 [Streptomyces sp. V17-9]